MKTCFVVLIREQNEQGFPASWTEQRFDTAEETLLFLQQQPERSDYNTENNVLVLEVEQGKPVNGYAERLWTHSGLSRHVHG